MNTPNYIQQSNNQTSVLLRQMYEQMGFAARHFPGWIDLRIKNLSLIEGKDFKTYTADRHVQYEAPLSVALSILATVPGVKAEPVKKELSNILTTSTRPESTEPQNESVGTSFSESGQLFVSNLSTSPASKFSGPVPVMQIEGRAAVNAKDLFQLWNSIDSRSLSGWMNYRIERRGLIAGKHFAEYDVPAAPGHRRGYTGYILSIDAAILIADSEPKGKGKQVAAYLINYRKDLAKQKLPNKAKLSDFIGLPPSNLVEVEPEPAKPTNEPPAAETTVQQTLFDENAVSSELPASEVVSPLLAENPGIPETPQIEENTDEVVSCISAGNPNAQLEEVFTQNGNNPHGEPKGVIQENLQNPETQQPTQDSTDGVDPEAQPPTVFDLLVSFAQSNLQQAQALAKLYRDLVMTQGTVSELVQIEQQVARQKLGLYPGVATIPNVTLRDKINYAVSKRAGITGEKHEDIFKAIYARLANDYGYSVLDMPKKKGQSHLNVCEEMGIISIVWDIVNTAAFNQYLARKATA